MRTRTIRTEVEALLQEAHALEILADDTEVEAPRVQDYWQVATDLITLVGDIEELRSRVGESVVDEAELLLLQRRTREVAARLAELTWE